MTITLEKRTQRSGKVQFVVFRGVSCEIITDDYAEAEGRYDELSDGFPVKEIIKSTEIDLQ